MKRLLTISIVLFGSTVSFAQSTAMNFNRKDCNGVQRHLFADLDSGKAVILEYFMINCAPCPSAGTKLESMKNQLLTQYPGKIVSYAIAYNNTYTQAQVKNWVSSNGFNMIPMDSGAAQVAYYGGMGMPTIVIAGGKTTHSVLGSPYIGFNNSDTTQMAADIRALLGTPSNTGSTVGLKENSDNVKAFEVFPNPVEKELSVTLNFSERHEYTIAMFDLSGKQVKLLDRGNTDSLTRTFTVTEMAGGNYFIRVTSGQIVLNRKITILH
jgi:hypothetical protein